MQGSTGESMGRSLDAAGAGLAAEAAVAVRLQSAALAETVETLVGRMLLEPGTSPGVVVKGLRGDPIESAIAAG